jgi:NAD(P)-dependent dehydrogenase (short-subunit alcohol dehydrogenase family)
MKSLKLDGKTAAITGATRGIGRAVCERMLDLGANVCAIARSPGELSAFEASAGSGHNGRLLAFEGNVSDYGSMGNAAKAAYEAFGSIDILVNNAGTGVDLIFEELTKDAIDTVIDVNLKGTIYCTRRFVPYMAKGGGNIINISSIAGTRGISDPPVNGNGIYTASKYGINGFSECMEKYLRKYNIRVSTICPGSTDTSWWERSKQGVGDGKMIPPEYIADIIELILKGPEQVIFKQCRLISPDEADSY